MAMRSRGVSYNVLILCKENKTNLLCIRHRLMSISIFLQYWELGLEHSSPRQHKREVGHSRRRRSRGKSPRESVAFMYV